MIGDVLYPLNELKRSNPHVYEKEVMKYTGREHILEDIIPMLDCLWNDVLHFSPVHPSLIKSALAECGKEFHAEYFEIPADMFDPKNTILYLNGEMAKKDPLNWKEYDPALLPRYSQMPELTKKYYKEKLEKGEQPLLYAKIPHVLYRGSMDTRGFERIAV